MGQIHVARGDCVILLLADGKETGQTIELTAEGNWTGSLTGLPKYRDGGVEIVYTVAEEAVPGYGDPVISGSAEAGFVVKNPLAPENPPTPPTPSQDVVPKTGDGMGGVVAGLCGLVALGLVGGALAIRRRYDK
jgi:hypothetical protein